MNLENLFRADNFYTLGFEEARPTLERSMYSYLGIFPLQKGERPQTDGKKIFLTSMKNDFQDDKSELHNNRNMSLYLSDLLHEILHIREGSFLVDSRPFLNTFTNPGLAHTIFNIGEDARIEYNAQSYMRPEDSELLRGSNQYYAGKRSLPKKIADRTIEIYSCSMIVKDRPSLFNPSLASLEQLILAEKVNNQDLRSLGIHTVDDLVKEMIKVTNQVYGRGVAATREVVPQVYDLLTKAFPSIEKEFPQKDSPYAPVSAPQLGSQKGKKGHESESTGENQIRESKIGKGHSEDDEEKKDVSQQIAYIGYRGDVHDFSSAEKKWKTLKTLVGNKGKDKIEGKSEATSPQGYSVGMGEGSDTSSRLVQIVTYDHLKKAYIHLAQLKFKEYAGKNPEFLKELKAYDSARKKIVEYFEMLRPNELQRIPFLEDPDELNMEAVIEVLADPSLRSKVRVYDSYIINSRDSLTAILLDISGSTSGRLESGKRVIDVEKISAGLVYQGLTEIGDAVLLYAFSTDNKTNLYQISGLENLGALRPEHGNADGVAIRGVISDIKKYEAKDKTLLMISDGRPVATGSGADPVIDTSMAFMEAENQGIRTVYFNIDNKPAEYFSTLVRNTTYAQSLRDVEQLPYIISDFILGHGSRGFYAPISPRRVIS